MASLGWVLMLLMLYIEMPINCCRWRQRSKRCMAHRLLFWLIRHRSVLLYC
ncbi:hypothetical protein I3843_05G141800 [Carya illinoinensis]|uniref:Uncharacterized protein n=1 Tax=Carya illinoinensis TaxID=32201 RepID=A0A922F038_CARIL|nr:hypothetical protein I3760_05G153800 [Carya illinoinensis]KAG6713413.1 hypothetical protein I3842_05G150600 [Carya illinoinensis]KAG7979653.1 hypothetical protein I3843_05G141800 [Carya illinoinensis]